MKLHLPLFKAVAAAMIPYCVMLIIEILHFEKNVSFGINWIALFGYFYTNLFEWWYHNFCLHKWKTFLRIGHAYHHAKLHGKNFKTRDPKRLLATTTNLYIFPILFTAHYFGFISFFGHQNAIAFFSGITFHFTICYEIAHWLTHVENNAIDKLIEKIKILNKIRAKQIEHHRLHHAEYNINFNFSPPYAGDKICKTKK